MADRYISVHYFNGSHQENIVQILVSASVNDIGRHQAIGCGHCRTLVAAWVKRAQRPERMCSSFIDTPPKHGSIVTKAMFALADIAQVDVFDVTPSGWACPDKPKTFAL